MPIEHTLPIELKREVRWGGAALTISSLAFACGIVWFTEIAYGEWDTTLGPELGKTAERLDEKWHAVSAVWTAEMIGGLVMALAGFLLRNRSSANQRWILYGAVWLIIGIGSILVATSYALVLGSYPPALNAFGEQPELFASIRGGLLTLHAVGSVLQLLGILIALACELRIRGRRVADHLVHAGILLAILAVAAVTAGAISGVYATAMVFVSGSLLGLSIWMDPDLELVARETNTQ